MAKVSLVLDDVVLALKKGKRQIAEDTANLNIPATVSSTGKRRFYRLDVSEEGLGMLQAAEEARDKSIQDAKTKYKEGVAKLKEDLEKAEASAWQELNKIADKVDESRPSRRKKDEESSADADNSADNSDSSDGTSSDDADSGSSYADSTTSTGDQYSGGYQSQPSQPSWGNN